jgi:glycosyltransferase involved in cell wall biosynthesis
MNAPSRTILAMTQPTSYPSRLLYVGDVRVEDSRSGPVQLYRLLCRHPANDLRIIETDLLGSKTVDLRLPDVLYTEIGLAAGRLRYTRFRQAMDSYFFVTAAWRARRFIRKLNGWQPQAILTVAHNCTWITAAAMAERLSVPLHLIIHDDPVAFMGLPQKLHRRAEKAFERIYRQAASRFAVSPAMADVYQTRFGAASQVLYPVRSPGAQRFDVPPEKLPRSENRSLTFAYAGSVSNVAYANALSTLADVLEKEGHRFLLFSDWDDQTIRRHRLDRSHVTVLPLAQSGQFLSELRERADALFVPMNFGPEDSWNVQMSFPSKLTDYTAVGLPIIIWAPPHSSAVRWATDNPGVAETVTEPGSEALAAGVRRLASDPRRRWEMGATALRVGEEHFSAETADRVFAPVLRTPAR